MDPFETHTNHSELIKDARQATRIGARRAVAPVTLFVIWGIVWLFGFLGKRNCWKGLWLLYGSGLTYLVLLEAPIAIVRYARQVRSPYGWRMGVFWVLLDWLRRRC